MGSLVSRCSVLLQFLFSAVLWPLREAAILPVGFLAVLCSGSSSLEVFMVSHYSVHMLFCLHVLFLLFADPVSDVLSLFCAVAIPLQLSLIHI